VRSSAILLFALAACAAPRVQYVTVPCEAQKAPAAPPNAPPATGSPASAARTTAAAPEPAVEVARLLETNPSAWAALFTKGAECEAAARAARSSSANGAWRALVACVAKTDFKSFKRVTDGFWDADLQTRPDAAQLLGAIIAARGADLPSDLSTLRKRRIPLFSLESVTAEPAFYRGRTVAFLARVDELEKGAKGRAVAQLSEVSKVGHPAGRTSEARYEETTKNDEHGRGYRARGAYLGVETKTHYQNELEETGISVKGVLTRVDPFFEPGGTFVVVGRFEGMEPAGDALDGDQATVTVQAYFQVGKESLVD